MVELIKEPSLLEHTRHSGNSYALITKSMVAGKVPGIASMFSEMESRPLLWIRDSQF